MGRDSVEPVVSPAVSVIMAVLNEERHLRESVDRLLDQDYDGPLQVIVAVGPSTDRTRDIADDIAASNPNVIVVDNPTGQTPSGLNAAIAAAEHDIIVRMDGHALVDPDYIAIGVDTLRRTGADNVGGVMAAEGRTDFEQAVATAMTAKIGVGGASFHVGGVEGSALTVYLGCFQKSALDRVGGYDESMQRAQDWEMNYRIRETGGTVWFNPAMSVRYRPRSSLRALSRQYFDYGRWRREVARRYPETVSLRYLAPPIAVIALFVALVGFVIGLVVSPLLAFIAAAVVAAYVLLVILGSMMQAKGLPWRAVLWLPVAIMTMHMSWGIGFIRGGAGR